MICCKSIAGKLTTCVVLAVNYRFPETAQAVLHFTLFVRVDNGDHL